jgi:hypothetical protein
MRIDPFAKALDVAAADVSTVEELNLFVLLAKAFARPEPAGELMSDPILVYRLPFDTLSGGT